MSLLDWAGDHFILYGIIWFVIFVIFIGWVIYASLDSRSKYFSKYSWMIRLPLIVFYILLLSLFWLSVSLTEPHLPKILIYKYVLGALLIGTFILSCIALFRVLFKRGTDSEMTSFDGTWATFSNESVEGEQAVDDGYNFMILVLVLHQFFNVFSMGYLHSNHLNKTSELVDRYVADEERPVLPEGYEWKDFKGVQMALMVYKSWDIDEDVEDGIKVFSFELEDTENDQLINPFMTVTIYPHEIVQASKKYRTYCYGFTEDIVFDDVENHEVIDKGQCFEENGWFRCVFVRKDSVDQKDDSTVLTIGLTDSLDQDVFVIRVIAKNENIVEVFKPVEPTIQHFFLRRRLIDLSASQKQQ